MKILLLTPQLPYPPISGGVIKSHKLVEYLAQSHQLTVACFLKSESYQQHLARFKTAFKALSVHAQSLNIPRTGMNFFKSCLKGVPLTIYRNTNAAFKQYVDFLANQYDVIFVDHYLMFQYVPNDYQGRVVVHQHNAEFVIWSRMAEQSSWLKKLLINFEANRIKLYEVKMCHRADVTLAAPNDQCALQQAGAQDCDFIDTYHLGDEHNLYCQSMLYEQTGLNLLFVGTLSWEANIDGLCWFLKDIWPLIKAQVPGVKFTIVGKCSPMLKGKLLNIASDIELAGFVDDLEMMYKSHRVFVAPLRFGSGIKVKVVNGLYRGIPTVTTGVGAEGLKLVNGEDIYIADNETAFASSVVKLLKDQATWQHLSTSSRAMMKQHYTWQLVMQNVQRSLTGEKQ
jgi:glycosyltransferase involved in cell wall biosynthesis